MFFWLTALLTIIVFPFTIIIGRPERVTTVRASTPHWFSSHFPLARLTPIVEINPWPWFQKHMAGRRIAGYAFLGFVVMNDDHDENSTVFFHECVHITHQSAVSPILYGLVYALDLLMYWPFSRWFTQRAYLRIPVGEAVAYRVANKTEHLKP